MKPRALLAALAAAAALSLPGAVGAQPAGGGRGWTEVVGETPEGGVRMGNIEAAIGLVQYASFSCRFNGEKLETATWEELELRLRAAIGGTR